MNEINEYELELSAYNKSKDCPRAYSVKKPVWEHIQMRIEGVFEYGGVMSLGVHQPQDSYFKTLEMRGVPGRYRLVAAV